MTSDDDSRTADCEHLWVLVGMPGVGKTTIGRHLARLRGSSFVDLDARVAQLAGLPVPVLLETYGEAHFRDLEHEVLRTVLAAEKGRRSVLSLGGGTFHAERNRTLLEKAMARTAYLRARISTLAQRLRQEDARSRPLLRLDEALGLDRLKSLAMERGPVFEAADLTVDSDDLEPVALARLLKARLEELNDAP